MEGRRSGTTNEGGGGAGGAGEAGRTMRWVRTLLLVPLGVVVSHSSLHAQCPDGSPPPCRVAPHVVVDSDALVILPFRVSGPPEVQYLREGVADLLNLALDGGAGWR